MMHMQQNQQTWVTDSQLYGAHERLRHSLVHAAATTAWDTYSHSSWRAQELMAQQCRCTVVSGMLSSGSVSKQMQGGIRGLLTCILGGHLAPVPSEQSPQSTGHRRCRSVPSSHCKQEVNWAASQIACLRSFHSMMIMQQSDKGIPSCRLGASADLANTP